MSNSYFNFTTGRMVAGENALAEDVNAAFDGVAAGLDLLPTPDQIKFLAGAHETTTGSSGNFVLALTADAYFDGMAVSFKANHSNSGACTLNVGSLGAKQLVDGNGSALAVGDIVANSIYAARYNSTSDKFHLVGLSSGNAADAAIVAANITDIGTIADNIDELLTVDDNAADAADSASAAQGYAQAAQDQAGYAAGHADAAALSAANLPNATTAGANKILTTNSTGDGWEYPAITAAGMALLDDANAAAQRDTLGVTLALASKTALAEFAGLAGNNGYRQIPNAEGNYTLVQWGRVSTNASAGTATTHSFPVAFSVEPYVVIAFPLSGSSPSTTLVRIYNYTTTGFTSIAGAAGVTVAYIAIGALQV